MKNCNNNFYTVQALLGFSTNYEQLNKIGNHNFEIPGPGHA